MNKTIRQTVVIAAPPKAVFGALVNEKRHTAFTGSKAVTSPKAGGAFSCYGGYIKGFNLELIPGKRIVQAWRSRNWEAGVYSVVTFSLTRRAPGRTVLTFTQIGVPASDFRDKSKGWRSHYWKPLKAFLEK